MKHTESGPIVHIGETIKFETSGFQKRILVIEINDDAPNYSDPLPIEFHKDKTHLLDKLQVGQHVNVSFFLSANEYEGKYYSSCKGVFIESLNEGESSSESSPEVEEHIPDEPDLSTLDDGDEDNLPF
jgi:hypothetical protein